MKFKLVAVFVCFAIASTIASDEHRPKLKVKDDVRGKRNLEYQISHHYPIGANFRLERRISSGPPNFQLNSRFPTYYSGPRPHIHRGRPHSIPPYAVQMEPLVQYSQRDPLYDTSKLPLTAEGHNDLSKPSDDLLTDNNHLSENVYPQNFHSSSYGQHHNEPPVYYQKEPEPIIEIIIKESNVTLPPVPVPTLPPKKKEPVQVFYVKYKKNPNGYGKDSVIYDKPVPALTPHVQEDDHEEPQLDQPHQEYVTLPPPPSTTLRTIIRPDSETYIGTSGIHVTFGSENKKHTPHPEGHEESAPQPAVAFPQAQTQQQHSSQNNHNHHINQHHPPQQQTQFSQPIPERKPHTSAFPPNLNPPVNFNQQTFGSRPAHNNQPPQFASTQYRPVHQQPARPFPQVLQNHQLRQPVAPPRNFQQQTFNHQRPISPPQLPSIAAQPKPSFNQFNPNHQTPSFPPNQFPPNQQFPPNHQFQFSQNQKPPQSQFPGFHQQFPPQSHKSQFSQILNQRPQTHFPVVQPQQQQQQQFNHKPSNPIEQHKPTQHQQHNQQQLRVNQQQQNYQFHNQHSIQHHRTNTHQQQQSQPQPQQNLQHHPQQNHQVHQPQNHQLHQQQNHQIHQQQQNRQQHQQSNQQQLQQNHQQQNHHQHNQQQHQQNQQQQQQLHQQQQQQHLQQLQQSTPHVIPPGGELLKSVPRYEQHISIPAEPSSSQIRNNQGVSSQALPLQSQSQINHNVAKPGTQALNQFNQQSGQQSFQQLQAQLQQQLQQQQQQLNLQVQQQIKSDQLLQQQKTLSPLDFQQQIQQQFNFPLQNFAQLNNINNLQGKQVSQTTSAPKQNNIYTQQLLNQKTQSQQNYFNTQQSSQNSFFTQQNIPNIYQTSSSSLPSSTSAPKIIYQSTTSTTTTTTTSKPVEKTEEKKTNKLPPNIQLPDEVPDDLREQLLSSGILSNADISVLDYDKIGDIPIDALPPDQLANFYGAGGAQQLAASERRETFVKPDGQPVDSKDSMVNIDQELSAEESEIDEVKTFEPKQLEMKVVRYDSESEQGQSVQQSYVQDDATHVDPVVLNDNKYNRYLPLKVNGAQFPIPDVPELKGRNISSVVVLAPVDYEFHQEHHNERSARDIEGDIKDVRFRAGEALKQLIKEPTKDNYKMWLEKENQTATDKQSVILLVTGSPESEDKEIFMYDVATKTVSKLSGELSSAFVEAAETNANDELPALSEIHETKLETEDSDIVAKYIHSNHNNDLVMSARNL